jgi:rSAM/selenodomain-associated transferase 1
MKTIILFLKYPLPGQVKTRLARSIGNEEAARIYKKMAEIVIAAARQTAGANILFFLDNDRFFKECAEWLGAKENLRVQCGDDIGQRMADAFNIAFDEGNKKVLLLGTDIPSLTVSIIQKAFADLEQNDSVLGQTMDGGYYLIGLKSSADFLFKNMMWSTNTVFSETHARIENNGMTCGQLPLLRDIDTLEDLEHESFSHYSRP